MKCYIGLREGNDAVAVCTVRGMGTCMNHTIRKEVGQSEGGYLHPAKRLPNKILGMFCPDCSAAFGEGK